MGEKAFYRKRAFLNNPSSHHKGWVSIDITAGAWGVEGDIHIGDCYRQVELDLSAHSKKGLNNSINKLNRFIEILEGARDNIEEAYEHYEKKKSTLKKKSNDKVVRSLISE
jgi:hypothetical protein